MTKDELNLSAANFGFDPTWVADILSKYGEDALTLAIEAARNGFSISLVIEVLQKFGPALLQLLVDVFAHKQAAMRMAMGEGTGVILPGDVVQGDNVLGIDASLLNVLVEKYLPIILEKYTPAIWTAFGPIIVQFVEANLQTILDKVGPQLMQLILQLFLSKVQNKM
jgi:hypothetical protein